MEEQHPLPEDALTRLEASTAAPEVRRIAAELLPAFYQQLRRIAQRTRARMGAGHTLQTTALVHEAYLRLGQARSFADETHFLRAAALAMRHALINYAQARVAEKRGGGAQQVTLSHIDEFSVDSDEGMLALDEAMEKLTREMPRLADVVECRFFGGYGEEDTARALGVSLRTVQRDWLKARAWLFRELGGTS
jgi:RNA polymerase sigma factor (TIGR02999 family)